MPFEYGSQQVDIPNPFKFEGAAYTARAAVLIVLGLFALLTVRTLVADGERVVRRRRDARRLEPARLRRVRGVSRPIQDVPLLRRPRPTGGSRRHRCGRAAVMPGARSGGATGYRGIYQPEELAGMLLGRKNPTFVEPEGWLPRLLHSLVANLISCRTRCATTRARGSRPRRTAS